MGTQLCSVIQYSNSCDVKWRKSDQAYLQSVTVNNMYTGRAGCCTQQQLVAVLGSYTAALCDDGSRTDNTDSQVEEQNVFFYANYTRQVFP